MDTRFLAVHSVFAISLLGAVDVWAQNLPSQNQPAARAQASSTLPDACKMMPQSDLEALFPGMPITKHEPTLSPISRGGQYVPQFVEGCRYVVELPSPTSRYNDTKFISLQILGWSTESTPTQAASSFASSREWEERSAADPKLNSRIEPISGVGDDAFMEIRLYDVDIYARKDDLVFIVTVAKYSRQTQPNATALAGQVAKRWRGGVGVVEAATPIAANTGIDIPPDTRVSRTAPASAWPDACALLRPEDVRKVFGDTKVDPPRKTMAKLTHYSRVDRVEDLPYPVGCSYHAVRTDLVNGQSIVRTYTIDIHVSDVAATVEAAKEHYKLRTETPVDGLGDEAQIDIANNIHMRQGVLNVRINVGGGYDDRDRALYADSRRRLLEIAKLVAARLPRQRALQQERTVPAALELEAR